MTKIIVKEVDRLYSRKKGKKYISEYLIYVNINGSNVVCSQVTGKEEKSLIVTEYLITYFDSLPNLNELHNYIEEITNYK